LVVSEEVKTHFNTHSRRQTGFRRRGGVSIRSIKGERKMGAGRKTVGGDPA